MKYQFSPLALFFSSIVFPLFMLSSASAQSDTDKCTKAQRSDWSASEKFVWEKLCNEQEADLVNFKKQKEKIGFKFLKDILLNDNYSKLLPTRIKIKNAIFNDKIDLVSENINKEINLTNSTFTNIVDLSYSIFSKSVNFKESEFYQELIFNDAIVKGGLSFNDVKFTLKNLHECRTLLNLQRIQVEGDLKIIKTVFSCSNPDLREVNIIRAKKSDQNYLIDLKAAKIKVSVYLKEVSVYLKEVSLVIDARTDVNKNIFQLGVGLIAAEIGDAVIIDQTYIPPEAKQISTVDMNQIKSKALISYANPVIVKTIKDDRIFKLFNSENNQLMTSRAKQYLSQLVVNLENANINTINILENSENKNVGSNKNSTISENSACKVRLGGFNYNQLNETAYKFLVICVDSLYREAIALTDQPREHNNANRQLVQLLQPMEKLASVSKSLGAYSVEKEMMYRQQKLEYYIAKTNLNKSKLNIIKAFNDIITHFFTIKNKSIEINFSELTDFVSKFVSTLKEESGQILILWWILVGNVFQDFTYGYGFERLRIFRIILIILIGNFFLALFVSYQKQKNIAYNSLYLRNQEIIDEEIENRCVESVVFDTIRSEIDTIRQLIFHKVDYDEKKEMVFHLYLKYSENNVDVYKEVKLDADQFKYLTEILDSRNPNHSKVGFCKNYYPRGNWSVVTYPRSSLINDKEKIDIYIIKDEKLIKEMNFESINPFKPFLETIKWILSIRSSLIKEKKEKSRKTINYLIKFLPNHPIIGSLYVRDILIKKRKKSLIKAWILLLPISLIKERKEKSRKTIIYLIKSLLNHPIIGSLLVTLILIIVIVGTFIFPYSYVLTNFITAVFMQILRYDIPLSSIALFLILFEVSQFIQQKKGEELSWMTQKNVENALLFSIDILIPIIELDKDNIDFITDAAEDYRWIRIYFRMEKLIGPFLISVLLPLILLTGL